MRDESLNKKINKQKQEIEELQHSMPEDTTNVLANQLSPILYCDPMQIIGDIERDHRGKGSKSRNIYVKFNSLKISKLIIKADRNKIMSFLFYK